MQLLKFFYSIFFNLTINDINKTSYRHIKDDLKNREATIKLDQKDLEVLYTYYAKYSNDVHDKSTSSQEIGFLEEILKGDNRFIKQIYNDLLKLTKQYDKIMINLFSIVTNDLTLAELQRKHRYMNSKQYTNLLSLMEK